jgi:tripartite-type tricarboxylate transporter receptor subunit TctC
VAGKELVIGSVAVGSTTYDVPIVLKAALGANFKIVPGYGGTANIRTALESREVDGMCTQFTDFTSGTSHWFDTSPPLAKFLLVATDKAPDHPWLKDIPTLPDVVRTEEARLMLAATTAPIAIAVPYAVAPEVPPERVTALREAFERAVADKEFWADAEKARFDAGPSMAPQVEARVRQVLDSPPAIVEQLRPIIK